MKLRREPYFLPQRENVQSIIIKLPQKNNILEYIVDESDNIKIPKNNIVYTICILVLVIMTTTFVLIRPINEYSTYKECKAKSGIWDKDNSICGFIVIYGDNL